MANEFQQQVTEKLANLESRIQDIEWRNMPLGPKPESHEPDPAVVDRLIDEFKKGTGKHQHGFVACGSDEQQCDSACQAHHVCGVCGKSRSEIAKDTADVKDHVLSSTESIIKDLSKIKNLRTLNDIVKTIAHYSKELDWLSREKLVEMAVREERP
jgi:hypothetical protein